MNTTTGSTDSKPKPKPKPKPKSKPSKPKAKPTSTDTSKKSSNTFRKSSGNKQSGKKTETTYSKPDVKSETKPVQNPSSNDNGEQVTVASLLSSVPPKLQNSNTSPENPVSESTNSSSYNGNKSQNLSLSEIVQALKDIPDASYIEEISKARFHSVEKYIEELEKSSTHHPNLQNRDKLEVLVNAIRTVNNQKTALVSIDIEAFERNTNIVTELGISIYDPIKEATSLVPSIINIHIILKEAFKLRNGSFVHDHKDNFLGGNSLVLNQKNTVKMVQSIIDYYFIERQKDGFDARFVAHNAAGDLKWLRQMGVKLPQNYESLDTERIYTFTHGQNGCSLGGILKRFNIPHSFLHNAGNDAYYTLIALLKMTDPHFRKVRKLDDFEEDEKYNLFSESQKDLLKYQNNLPKRNNQPRKQLKSHEFSPYIEYFSHQDALLKIFEYH
ncbi:hypothetical protein BN7_6058 [Wickerhamomyces ciferrii]|uniref:Gfd2/YDR514C-like C-terminal domain-containing protein n=1 Tax=Wickerhamomyces ciferrii (strain ATCC 14091 / BCRC 22168 / CBS 111 / JCM 3599 / NBRC 0793 / NRRL Y-1031 F-60-10) TaxID=1206466 RepID=K0KMG1_WICCF|nr:uncharacterized protein BN7_6058 [Wickerhamomyces ciferrii]CCH46465.1 hypothetical protein BN7_6058 [Wickerhamomyces ciferrii]